MKDFHQLDWLRKEFLELDDIINPLMGIKDWDDSVCVEFGTRTLVVSADGPYKKRLVMKSALIHASTDVIVKGARPLFALDTLTGTDKEVRDMAKSLRKQAEVMHIPILGGNTMIEDAEPTASLTIIGELLTKQPIRDSTASKNDLLLVLGNPIWGTQKERFENAKTLFKTWFKLIKEVKINASKDITKGGLLATANEIAEKSGLTCELNEHPFHPYRNLDNFLITVSKTKYQKIEQICKDNNCPIVNVGKLQ